MIATVRKRFSFEAAHSLPHLAEGHKCRLLHGHSYRVEIAITGPVDPSLGWVVDYADITLAWGPIGSILDHANLDDLGKEGLSVSTAENLAIWIHQRIRPLFDKYQYGSLRVSVSETDATWVDFEG